MILFLIGTLVFQNGDTLFFLKDGFCVDTMIMRTRLAGERGSFSVVEQAKTASDSMTYLIYSATYTETVPESLVRTTITFYSAKKKKLWEEKSEGERSISFELSGIYGSLFVVAAWDRFNGNPSFDVIKDAKKKRVVKEGEWQRIVSYEISPNERYILFHTRNPYNGVLWDYIFFCDLKTGNHWDYVFPTCLSCKKSKIDLEVDENGRSTVIHKQEHRVFSPEGVLEDIYLKLQ
jgi:hypothetical protein